MIRRPLLFWTAITFAGIAAGLPYFLERAPHLDNPLADLLLTDVLGPILYLGCFGTALRLSQRKSVWWLATLGPIAFWPLLLTVYTFACWGLHGFAP